MRDPQRAWRFSGWSGGRRYRNQTLAGTSVPHRPDGPEEGQFGPRALSGSEADWSAAYENVRTVASSQSRSSGFRGFNAPSNKPYVLCNQCWICCLKLIWVAGREKLRVRRAKTAPYAKAPVDFVRARRGSKRYSFSCDNLLQIGTNVFSRPPHMTLLDDKSAQVSEQTTTVTRFDKIKWE